MISLTRRSALLAAGAATLVRPHRALAKGSTGGIMASHFNGATVLRNDAALVGSAYVNIPKFPAASPYGIISYWYRGTAPGGVVLTQQNPSSGLDSVWISHNIYPQRRGTLYALEVQLESNGGSSSLGATYLSAPGTIKSDNGYHHVAITFNTNVLNPNPSILVWLDEVATGSITQAWPTSAFSVLYGQTNAGAPLNWYHGHDNGNCGSGCNPYLLADQAEFHYFSTSGPIDYPTEQANFIDTSTGLPLRQPPYGAILSTNERAQIYLWGPSQTYPMNLGGGTWSWPSTYTDSNPPSSFYTAAGGLTMATDDPWGFLGET